MRFFPPFSPVAHAEVPWAGESPTTCNYPLYHPGIYVICLPHLVQRGGFLPDDVLSFVDLAADADRRLFRSHVSSPSHVLSRHLPAIKTTNYNLRPRAHGFTLPEKDTCNFIPWMLFERIYC